MRDGASLRAPTIGCDLPERLGDLGNGKRSEQEKRDKRLALHEAEQHDPGRRHTKDYPAGIFASEAGDERDRQITGQAARISGVILSIGVLVVIGRILVRGAMDEAAATEPGALASRSRLNSANTTPHSSQLSATSCE